MSLSDVSIKTILLIVAEKFASKPKSQGKTCKDVQYPTRCAIVSAPFFSTSSLLHRVMSFCPNFTLHSSFFCKLSILSIFERIVWIGLVVISKNEFLWKKNSKKFFFQFLEKNFFFENFKKKKIFFWKKYFFFRIFCSNRWM